MNTRKTINDKRGYGRKGVARYQNESVRIKYYAAASTARPPNSYRTDIPVAQIQRSVPVRHFAAASTSKQANYYRSYVPVMQIESESEDELDFVDTGPVTLKEESARERSESVRKYAAASPSKPAKYNRSYVPVMQIESESEDELDFVDTGPVALKEESKRDRSESARKFAAARPSKPAKYYRSHVPVMQIESESENELDFVDTGPVALKEERARDRSESVRKFAAANPSKPAKYYRARVPLKQIQVESKNELEVVDARPVALNEESADDRSEPVRKFAEACTSKPANYYRASVPLKQIQAESENELEVVDARPVALNEESADDRSEPVRKFAEACTSKPASYYRASVPLKQIQAESKNELEVVDARPVALNEESADDRSEPVRKFAEACTSKPANCYSVSVPLKQIQAESENELEVVDARPVALNEESSRNRSEPVRNFAAASASKPANYYKASVPLKQIQAESENKLEVVDARPVALNEESARDRGEPVRNFAAASASKPANYYKASVPLKQIQAESENELEVVDARPVALNEESARDRSEPVRNFAAASASKPANCYSASVPLKQIQAESENELEVVDARPVALNEESARDRSEPVQNFAAASTSKPANCYSASVPLKQIQAESENELEVVDARPVALNEESARDRSEPVRNFAAASTSKPANCYSASVPLKQIQAESENELEVVDARPVALNEESARDKSVPVRKFAADSSSHPANYYRSNVSLEQNQSESESELELSEIWSLPLNEGSEKERSVPARNFSGASTSMLANYYSAFVPFKRIQSESEDELEVVDARPVPLNERSEGDRSEPVRNFAAASTSKLANYYSAFVPFKRIQSDSEDELEVVDARPVALNEESARDRIEPVKNFAAASTSMPANYYSAFAPFKQIQAESKNVLEVVDARPVALNEGSEKDRSVPVRNFAVASTSKSANYFSAFVPFKRIQSESEDELEVVDARPVPLNEESEGDRSEPVRNFAVASTSMPANYCRARAPLKRTHTESQNELEIVRSAELNEQTEGNTSTSEPANYCSADVHKIRKLD